MHIKTKKLIIASVIVALLTMIAIFWIVARSAVADLADTSSDSDAGEEIEPTFLDEALESDLPVIFSIHMEAKSARECGGVNTSCKTDEEFVEMMDVVERMIDIYNETGLKGTFEMHIQWIQRLPKTDQGRRLIQAMIDGGHEPALHHHGMTQSDWDGYSDEAGASDSDEYLGSMSDYLEIVHQFEDDWGVELTTTEGTGLKTDSQEEWIYRTSDDQNNSEAYTISDPDGVCPVGRPVWTLITLPNQPRSAQGYTSIGHTHFGTKNAACTENIGAQLLERINEIIDEGYDSNDVINFVFHPMDYGTDADNMDAHDAFYRSLSEIDELYGMTVQQYMCERVDICYE